MAVKTERVRDLVDFAPEGFLVTSFYLNVNPAEFLSPDDIVKSLDSELHAAEEKVGQFVEGLSHDARESVRGDLARIEEFVLNKFERVDTQGLAVFSCAGMGFWEVYMLTTPVQSGAYFEPEPYVAPLATFLSHSKPTAILLTDRQQARILTMKHGEVKEWSQFEDYVPPRSEAGGWSQMRYQRRSDHWAKHHVDHAAELVLKLEQHYPFDWLILRQDPEIKNVLDSDLHPYVRDRVIGTINVSMDAPEEKILEEARKVREEAETHLIDDLVKRVQEYAGAGGRGTIGLKDTLEAMNEQKIHILLVQEGYTQSGSVCTQCQMLYAESIESCPACGGPAQQTSNIVDILIQRGLQLGSRVEVATEYEQLKPIEYVGSIMYY